MWKYIEKCIFKLINVYIKLGKNMKEKRKSLNYKIKKLKLK